jgi:hypothetical protein
VGNKQDHVSANLPALNFEDTLAFYQNLGFHAEYLSDQWMILVRGPLEIEFFLHETLQPLQSDHSVCIWVQDLEGLYVLWSALDWQDYTAPVKITEILQDAQIRRFSIIDINGNLLRCLSLN